VEYFYGGKKKDDSADVEKGMESLKELYKIGRGPSSSHTIGPEKACMIFKKKNSNADKFKVILYGSLAKTGKGHGSDVVIRKTFAPKECEVEFNYLESKLLDKFVEDKIGIEYDNKNMADFVDYVMNGGDYVKTIHAFYPHKHPNPQNTAYNAYSRAVAALDNLKAIEDSEARFERMRTEIGKAPFVQGFSVTGSDYYFTYGQMSEKYESEAFSLDIYGVGELIRTDDGYYVIMRVPMVEDEVQMRVNELLSQYQYATLKRAEDARREELTFEGNEYFDGLKLIDIK
jgi:hypothetical protein